MLLCNIARADQVENPAYKAWAKFAVGSSATLTMKTEAAGQTTTVQSKQTLSSLDDAKAVIQVETSMVFNGQTINTPAQKIEIQKTVDTSAAGAGQKNIDPKALENATEESVTVPAGTFKAKVIESTFSQAGSNFKSKVWYTEDVPGGVVKMESSSDGAVKSTVSSELAAVEKK